MKHLNLVALLAFAIASVAYAQANSTPVITVGHSGLKLAFQCEGGIGSSKLTVFPSKSNVTQPIFSEALEDSDDCSEVTWITEDIDPKGLSTLVLVNPGRIGPNSQVSAFLVHDGLVSAAGHIPTGAERVIGSTSYLSYSADADSVWQRTDSLLNGKFVVSHEMRLMRSGSMCFDKFGGTLLNSSCGIKAVRATPANPICIGYSNHVGKRISINACADLETQ